MLWNLVGQFGVDLLNGNVVGEFMEVELKEGLVLAQEVCFAGV